ncbi:hypothetical protein ACVWZ7_003876 [Arthrobacter sp. TE12232]
MYTVHSTHLPFTMAANGTPSLMPCSAIAHCLRSGAKVRMLDHFTVIFHYSWPSALIVGTCFGFLVVR